MRQSKFQQDRARELRRNMTPAEAIMWKLLRSRRFAEFKFRRQLPFLDYILDFYCCELRLVIELDGESHLGKEQSDLIRQRRLEEHGLRVLRFWNNEVYDDCDAVLELIWRVCQERKGNTPVGSATTCESPGEGRIQTPGQSKPSPSPPTPLPRRGEGRKK